MNFWDFINAWRERQQRRWELNQLQKSLRVAAGNSFWQRCIVPTERQFVTLGIFVLAVCMLLMAREDPKLWENKLFEILLQGLVLTGLLSMILGFHFAANKSDETKSDNTGKSFDAMKAQAEAAKAQIEATLPVEEKPDIILEPGETAQAKET